jgi:hypothetical protein
MVIYNCINCTKEFNHKSDYLRHINRKYSCKKSNNRAEMNIPRAESCRIVPEKVEFNDEYDKGSLCQYCLKSFSNNSCRNRHVKSGCCPIKNKIELETEVKETDMIQLKEEIKELKDIILKMNASGPNSINSSINKNNNSHNNMNSHNNTNNSTNNTLNNVVNINVFGKEDVSHITNETYKQIFRRCKNSVPAFIKIKHFSSKKPENSNVYISDLKGQYAVLYNGEQWNIEDKNEMLQNLYDANCGQLMDKYADMKDELDEVTVRKYDRFVETMDEPETEHNAKEEIKKILYNEKEKSIKNRKSTKKMLR